jgi:hypothetical protein
MVLCMSPVPLSIIMHAAAVDREIVNGVVEITYVASFSMPRISLLALAHVTERLISADGHGPPVALADDTSACAANAEATADADALCVAVIVLYVARVRNLTLPPCNVCGSSL